MSFDSSRFTFDPRNDFLGVVMQQGRVQLDSDWNEWLAELRRRIQAGTLDTMGRAVVPQTTPNGFEIKVITSGGATVMNIGPGRMYVDGLLVENHGLPTPGSGGWTPATGLPGPPAAGLGWDGALAELVGQNPIPYTQQPYLPSAPAFPNTAGPFLAYLDVWQREVTFLEYPDMVEKAVGVDTTGRLQVVWQVKVLDLSQTPGVTCATPDSGIPAWSDLLRSPGARLTTGVVQSAQSGPCCLTPNTGYTGLENQLYRVEIHTGGALGTATFKWSRDDASVATGVTAIEQSGTTLTVQSVGKDDVLRFSPNDWVEITDDWLELSGKPGELHQIKTVSDASSTITLFNSVSSASFPVDASGLTTPGRHTRLQRWDQSGVVFKADGVTVWTDLGAVGATGDIPVPPAGTTLILEDGITVTFDEVAGGGPFKPQDFWTFAARTADGTVEYLDQAPPRGIHHHYARLSVVDLTTATATNCRVMWPPNAGSCDCCCTNTVGIGLQGANKYTSIQAAIDALPATGGEVCILPGRYFENVLIEGKQDIVIHGCGGETRVASKTLAPGAAQPVPATGNTFNAVFTIAESQHIELRSLAVEAADEEVGVLIDSLGKLVSRPGGDNAPPGNTPSVTQTDKKLRHGAVDICVKDVVITASTLPAILASGAQLLRVEENRIAMEDVASMWPAVYVNGREVHIDRNWVGLQSKENLRVWMPASVAGDLSADAKASTDTPAAKAAPAATGVVFNPVKHPGGIQIAGFSQDVFVIDNEIEGGSRNGITLGSFDILDAKGKPTGQIVGILTGPEDPCATTGTLGAPGTVPGTPGKGGSKVVSGGPLLRIAIDRNRIRFMGLCGIGPVGFFNLTETLEVISILDLTIAGNDISRTLQRVDFKADAKNTLVGYGAICVPDVVNLIIRDNSISDYGAQPGLDLCGIYILLGEMVEISRNQVLDYRDLVLSSVDTVQRSGLPQSGILVLVAMPLSLVIGQSLPGVPALRIEDNVVRVPLGTALSVVGFGPFSIVNNHFGCGGTIRAERAFSLAQTVLILNLGTAIELGASAVTPSGVNKNASGPTFGRGAVAITQSSSGAVLFTNNMCQLETRGDRQVSIASVMILTADHLIFSSNHCWLDASAPSAVTDALLVAGSLQVTGNRFQEARSSVFLSGWTIGALNITSQNISTFCLLIQGAARIRNDNLAVIDGVSPGFCERLNNQ